MIQHLIGVHLEYQELNKGFKGAPVLITCIQLLFHLLFIHYGLDQSTSRSSWTIGNDNMKD